MDGATAPATLNPPSALPQNDFLTDSDDGPFFDLQLDQNDDEETDDDDNNNDSDSDSDSDSENEFKLTLSPSTNHSQPNSNPHFTASLLKSATKFRVFMLGLKKPRPNAAPAPAPAPNMKPRQRKLFTVKFKVEEVPIVSFFTSSRSKASHNQNTHSETEIVSSSASASASEDKRLVRKYLKKVYVRVSRSYSEMLRISDPVDVVTSPIATEEEEDSETANVEGRKQGNVPLPAGLRRHLGKGRSAVAVAAPPFASSKRRDESLLQQQDCIQGAILHCKTSFNASTECETSQLPQSVNEPLPDKSTNEKCL